MADKKWIKGAIEHPGALKEMAKKAGAMMDDGTISKEWLRKMASKGGRVGKMARLAITLGHMKKG